MALKDAVPLELRESESLLDEVCERVCVWLAVAVALLDNVAEGDIEYDDVCDWLADGLSERDEVGLGVCV